MNTLLSSPRPCVYGQEDTFTAIGIGSQIGPLPFAPHKHSVAVVSTGAPTSYSVSVEASLDGQAWYAFNAAITADGLTFIGDKPLLYYRAHLTALAGGTSPTVTVQWVGVGSD